MKHRWFRLGSLAAMAAAGLLLSACVAYAPAPAPPPYYAPGYYYDYGPGYYYGPPAYGSFGFFFGGDDDWHHGHRGWGRHGHWR